MKNRLLISASWCVTAFVLAGGGAAAWRNHRAIVREHEECGRLDETVSSGGRSERGGRSRQQLQARDDAARDFARRLIQHWKDLPPESAEGDEAVKARLDLFIEWGRLDAQQLKIVIAALSADVDLLVGNRTKLLGMGFRTLASEDPSACLTVALSPEWREMIRGDLSRFGVVSMAIYSLAQKDVDGALAWLRQHPEWNDAGMKRMLVSVAAQQDVRRAFQMTDGDASLGYTLVQSTGEKEWLSLLAAVREKDAASEKCGKFRDKVLDSIAQHFSDEGPAAAQGWLDQAVLNETEGLAFLGGIRHAQDHEHAGEWIEWAAARLPAGKERDRVMKRVRDEWKKKDEAAAAEFARKNGM